VYRLRCRLLLFGVGRCHVQWLPRWFCPTSAWPVSLRGLRRWFLPRFDRPVRLSLLRSWYLPKHDTANNMHSMCHRIGSVSDWRVDMHPMRPGFVPIPTWPSRVCFVPSRLCLCRRGCHSVPVLSSRHVPGCARLANMSRLPGRNILHRVTRVGLSRMLTRLVPKHHRTDHMLGLRSRLSSTIPRTGRLCALFAGSIHSQPVPSLMLSLSRRLCQPTVWTDRLHPMLVRPGSIAVRKSNMQRLPSRTVC
jgi:hypothetical protein